MQTIANSLLRKTTGIENPSLDSASAALATTPNSGKTRNQCAYLQVGHNCAQNRRTIKRKNSRPETQKLDREVVERRITNWLAAARIAVRNPFSCEQILCDQVFAGAGAIKESYFAEISKDAASDLLRFPESVAAKCMKSPENMFRVLDLYDSLSNLLPKIESIFCYESTSTV
ncbi:hypothetical protein AAC387_Pa11g1731 [Persea americana]